MKFYKTIILVFIVVLLNNEIIYPCIMITAANDTIVLAGNNKDCSDPDTYVWFTRKSEYRKYGCIFFGYSNFRPQAGMNEAGLCFITLATAPNPVPVLYEDELLLFPLADDNIHDMVMRSCSTVSEVISTMQQYNLIFMKNYQLMFVDKFGGSAIIEGDKVIWKNDYYQVCTNFYHTNPSLGGYPCWRYDTAIEMFEEHADSISIPLLKDILDETHQEGQFTTLYTNIYDLQNGTVYLYYNHYYEEVIKIDLLKELNKGHNKYIIPTKYSIPSLYSNLIVQSPEDGLLIDSTSITLNWEGEGEYYELYYSLDSEFNSYEIIEIEVSNFIKKALVPFGLILILPFFFTKRDIGTKRIIQSLLIFQICYLSVSCNLNRITSSTDEYEIKVNGKSVNVTIHSLLPNTTYYWQVKAENKGPFRSESPIYKFIIASDL